MMFVALLPVWVRARPAVGAAAFAGVVYGLFAYVSVTHGKERPAVGVPPAPYPTVGSVAVLLLISIDLGYFI